MTSIPVPELGAVGAETRRQPPGWLRTVLRADIWITGTFFVVLTAVTFLGVVMRYFFNDPFVWLEEVQLALFLGVVYLGGGSAFRHGAHVAIDFLVERMGGILRTIVLWFAHIVVVAVLAYFAWQGYHLVADIAATGRTTNILRIPSVLIYAMVPVGLVWTIINYVCTVVFGEEEEPEVEF